MQTLLDQSHQEVQDIRSQLDNIKSASDGLAAKTKVDQLNLKMIPLNDVSAECQSAIRTIMIENQMLKQQHIEALQDLSTLQREVTQHHLHMITQKSGADQNNAVSSAQLCRDVNDLLQQSRRSSKYISNTLTEHQTIKSDRDVLQLFQMLLNAASANETFQSSDVKSVQDQYLSYKLKAEAEIETLQQELSHLKSSKNNSAQSTDTSGLSRQVADLTATNQILNEKLRASQHKTHFQKRDANADIKNQLDVLNLGKSQFQSDKLVDDRQLDYQVQADDDDALSYNLDDIATHLQNLKGSSSMEFENIADQVEELTELAVRQYMRIKSLQDQLEQSRELSQVREQAWLSKLTALSNQGANLKNDNDAMLKVFREYENMYLAVQALSLVPQHTTQHKLSANSQRTQIKELVNQQHPLDFELHVKHLAQVLQSTHNTFQHVSQEYQKLANIHKAREATMESMTQRVNQLLSRVEEKEADVQERDKKLELLHLTMQNLKAGYEKEHTRRSMLESKLCRISDGFMRCMT